MSPLRSDESYSRHARLLHHAVARGKEQVRAVFVRAGVDDRFDVLVGLQRDEVDERGAARGAVLHRDLVRPQPVHAAAVREEQQVRVRGRREQVLDVVLVAEVAAAHALAAAALRAELVDRDRLDVALLRQHDDELFVLDEVEVGEVAGVVVISVRRSSPYLSRIAPSARP